MTSSNGTAAIEKLVGEFSDSEYAAHSVFRIGRHYGKLKAYAKANEVYQRVVDNWPEDDLALQAQQGIALSNIELGNAEAAAAAIAQLISEFPRSRRTAEAVYQIAEYYNELEEYDRAKEVYQSIAYKWPVDEEFTIRSNIKLGNKGDVQAAIEKLLDEAGDDKDTPSLIYRIALQYGVAEEYEDSRRFYQCVVKNWPGNKFAMIAQQQTVLSNIELGDEAGAAAGVEQMVVDFNDWLGLPKLLYEIAERYESEGQYEQAKGICERIVSICPASRYGRNSAYELIGRKELIILSILTEDEGDIEAQLSDLIADFNDDRRLPTAVFGIGERYYTAARMSGKQGLADEAKGYFLKAIAVWETIINNLPPCATTPQAYYVAAVCYSQELGEYQKGIEYYQKIVDNWPDYEYAWHAQFFVGKYYEKLLIAGGITESEAEPKIEQAYISVVERYPDSKSAPSAALKLGQLNFRKERWVEAAEYFELFLAKYPEDRRCGRVVYDLGLAYERMGQIGRAVEVYVEFIETADPNDRSAERIMSRLEELGGQDK